ncbi:hypothetical protein CISG_05896 [Coccidioides immitis RMSCC 3703]|uniref:Uncharacterized protein n=2 Tax=Coccidioides immitis TaxID=5501 RepID=A0A0J8QZE1_COCIT|nr:hypothetical protein CIRG_10311 [Coccidioides immitis RMSCC 2394]KMU76753.1 hypothetical protein CISG_05896 [Coccidioides immitis RMSCC 3703]
MAELPKGRGIAEVLNITTPRKLVLQRFPDETIALCTIQDDFASALRATELRDFFNRANPSCESIEKPGLSRFCVRLYKSIGARVAKGNITGRDEFTLGA